MNTNASQQQVVSPRWQWHWLCDSPLVVAVWACLLAITVLTVRATRATRAANRLQVAVSAAQAELVAEEAALAAASRDAQSTAAVTVPTRAGWSCTVEPPLSVPGLWQVTTRLPSGRRERFRYELLPGMAPAALGVPFACARATVLPAGWPRPMRLELPLLQAGAFVSAGEWAATNAIVRDDGIALLRLPAGTDRDDFVLGNAKAERLNFFVPANGVVAVDGNLWLDADPTPLTMGLDRDLTLLVRGNFYVLRSLHVTGPGRLLVVTLAGVGAPLCERDANGRWAGGDGPPMPATEFSSAMEGSGGVWLGLPGLRRDELELECGVVVGGELQIAVDLARITGPMVLSHGAVVLGGARGVLEPTGARLPCPQREQVPGFASSGRPRPGRLVRILER